MCHISFVLRGNGFSQETVFLDPTGKKRYMLPGATMFSFNQTRKFEMDFARNLGFGTDVHRGAILGYRYTWVLEISLVLAKDVQG